VARKRCDGAGGELRPHGSFLRRVASVRRWPWFKTYLIFAARRRKLRCFSPRGTVLDAPHLTGYVAESALGVVGRYAGMVMSDLALRSSQWIVQ
jgi:hypothetical protein